MMSASATSRAKQEKLTDAAASSCSVEIEQILHILLSGHGARSGKGTYLKSKMSSWRKVEVESAGHWLVDVGVGWRWRWRWKAVWWEDVEQACWPEKKTSVLKKNYLADS